MKRNEHPLTPALVLRLGEPDEWIPKIYVRKMGRKRRLLRPRWKAAWSYWVIEDGGAQEVVRDGRHDWTVK